MWGDKVIYYMYICVSTLNDASDLLENNIGFFFWLGILGYDLIIYYHRVTQIQYKSTNFGSSGSFSPISRNL